MNPQLQAKRDLLAHWQHVATEARKALVQIQKRIDCTPDQPLSSVADLVKKGLEDGKVEA